MPEISRFFGIVVAMFFDDHAPPHFHVTYAGRRASLAIEDLRILDGKLPPRVRGLVVEWAALHQDALARNWEHARSKEPLEPIPPLE